MNITSGLAMFGFISIFHVVGGGVVGFALRRLFRGLSLQPIFLLVWGSFFGGMPLFIGATELAAKGMPLFFAGEIVILFGTILLVAFIPDWIVEGLPSQGIFLMLFGSVFLIAGVGAGIAAWREAIAAGLAMIFVFGGIGALMLGLGFKSLLKGN